jgi:hypothetical protein
VTWKSPLSVKFLGHFSPIVPFSVAGGLLWRKLERSKSLVLLQVGGWKFRWQRHSAKPSCLECSTTVEQAETQVRVVVPIEEEEERKWKLEKSDGKAWTGFTWLRTGKRGGLI